MNEQTLKGIEASGGSTLEPILEEAQRPAIGHRARDNERKRQQRRILRERADAGDEEARQAVEASKAAKRLAYHRARLANPEAFRASQRANYLRNRESRLRATKKWSQSPKGRVAIRRKTERNLRLMLKQQGNLAELEARREAGRENERKLLEERVSRFAYLDEFEAKKRRKPLPLEKIKDLVTKHKLKTRDLAALTGKSRSGVAKALQTGRGKLAVRLSTRLILLDQHPSQA